MRASIPVGLEQVAHIEQGQQAQRRENHRRYTVNDVHGDFPHLSSSLLTVVSNLLIRNRRKARGD